MKMQFRIICDLVIASSFALLLYSLFIQQKRLILLNEKVTQIEYENHTYKIFISESFHFLIDQEEINHLINISERDSSYLKVFVPSEVCQACFSSLLQYLDISNIDKDSVHIYLEETNPYVSGQSRYYKFHNVCVVSGVDYPVSNEILLVTKSNNQISCMRYSDGSELIMSLFLKGSS